MTPSPTIDDQRRHAPATERNRDAILAILAKILPAHGTILEIASGSGEHVQHFAEACRPCVGNPPTSIWPRAPASPPGPPIPSSPTSRRRWHSMPWRPIGRSTARMSSSRSIWCRSRPGRPRSNSSGAARLLPGGAPLYLPRPTGVRARAGGLERRVRRRSLRRRNPVWGLRSLEALTEAADAAGFDRDEPIEMPANDAEPAFFGAADDRCQIRVSQNLPGPQSPGAHLRRAWLSRRARASPSARRETKSEELGFGINPRHRRAGFPSRDRSSAQARGFERAIEQPRLAAGLRRVPIASTSNASPPAAEVHGDDVARLDRLGRARHGAVRQLDGTSAA